VANLQATKDKEIATLKADLDTARQDLEAKVAELGSANDRIQQLTSAADAAAKELSDAKAALAAEQERYREQIGLALKPPADALKDLHGRELAVAALKARS
jgi:predicted  nucleic acid-binding Zn-ribbon protein